MSRFNTGNPIGSGSPLDLDDNAKNLDVLVNSTAETNPDRFGRSRLSYQGMENKYNRIIDGMGLYPAEGSFETGGTITERNQYLTLITAVGEQAAGGWSWGGTLPKTVTAGSTPETSGGIGPNAWVYRSDATVRAALADGSADIGGQTATEVASATTSVQIAPSSSLFNQAVNINSADNPTSLDKNRAGSNQDTWVMLFGDSHGWGQGAPENDRFQASSNWSRWSSPVFNEGFMARIGQYLEKKKGWAVNKYGAGMIVAQNYLHAANNYIVETGDPEQSKPLVCLGGNITSLTGNYAPGDNTLSNWYNPQLQADAYSNISYREKVSAGIFGPNYLRLQRCNALNMPTNGKEHYWEITPNPSAVSYGAGFTDVSYDNGAASPVIFGGMNTTTSTVFFNSGSPKPDWVKAGAKVYVPGYGVATIGATGGVNGSAGITGAGAGLLKQLHLGLKIYPAVYATGLLMAEMRSPARAVYIAVRRQIGGGKIRLAFTTNMNGGFVSFPYVDNTATFRNSANSWAWKPLSGVPQVQRVSSTNVLSTVAEATSDAFGVVIDTEHTSTEEVVYRIDFGGRQQGRLFVLLDDVAVNDFVDIRGIVFDNNKVSNYSMGAHTVGAWIGTQNTTAGDGVRDRVADILNYTPVKPGYVITQIPFVNEYLVQTPIATFKANLQAFVDKFLNHLPSTNNYNNPSTSFMFFTSLRNREVFNGGAQSAITYDDYVTAAIEFCETNGHAFVDCEKELFRLVESGRVNSERLFNDSNHPSDYANEVIARVLEQDYLQFMV